MQTKENIRMFTQQEMSDLTKIPKWLEGEYKTFSSIVSAPKFPCYFGTLAEKRGEVRYTYIEEDDYRKLPHTLASFLELSRANPDKRQNLTVFFEPEKEEQSLEFYKNKTWEVLQYLHSHDPAPWPEEVPYDSQNRSWEFCFDGEPVFVFSASPAYKKRHSRNYGNSLILLFQPTRLFNGFESDVPEGIKARNIIRTRLLEWDEPEVDIPADSSKLGEKKDYYWKQYIISDDNEPIQGGCPFHMKDKT
ncbi:YqcI/YcgG family protein [Paenibacillus solani]|nr:YqcI/YcgG family protein [Paenibacillus solani]